MLLVRLEPSRGGLLECISLKNAPKRLSGMRDVSASLDTESNECSDCFVSRLESEAPAEVVDSAPLAVIFCR